MQNKQTLMVGGGLSAYKVFGNYCASGYDNGAVMLAEFEKNRVRRNCKFLVVVVVVVVIAILI